MEIYSTGIKEITFLVTLWLSLLFYHPLNPNIKYRALLNFISFFTSSTSILSPVALPATYFNTNVICHTNSQHLHTVRVLNFFFLGFKCYKNKKRTSYDKQIVLKEKILFMRAYMIRILNFFTNHFS